jgi:hypothetical protein
MTKVLIFMILLWIGVCFPGFVFFNALREVGVGWGPH